MKKDKIKSILITGCNGLLGKAICKRLSSLDIKVYGIVHNKKYEPIENINYINIDLANLSTENNLPKEIDCIMHLAQSSNFRNFPEYSQDIFNVNVASTSFLLNYANKIGVKKFIFASSGGVYGNGGTPFSEKAPLVPPGELGFYLGTKACGEILVESYASFFNVIIIRPFFIYGKGQNRSMLIPRIMDSIKNGKPIFLHDNKGISINPIHVEDAVSTVLATLKKEFSATFNIAGPEILSILDISNIMSNYLNKEAIYKNIDNTPMDLIADIALMKKELYIPKRTIKNYLIDVIN